MPNCTIISLEIHLLQMPLLRKFGSIHSLDVFLKFCVWKCTDLPPNQIGGVFIGGCEREPLPSMARAIVPAPVPTPRDHFKHVDTLESVYVPVSTRSAACDPKTPSSLLASPSAILVKKPRDRYTDQRAFTAGSANPNFTSNRPSSRPEQRAD